MNEFWQQFRNNKMVRYGTLGGFILLSYIFSGGNFFTTLISIAGLWLGRKSVNEPLDEIKL